MGNVVAPVQVPGGGQVWFRGRATLDAMMSVLKAEYGLASAAHVILKGCSAGGLATLLNADYVGSLMPASVAYSAAPGAGFFMDLPGFDGNYHYRGNYQWVFTAMNITSTTNTECLAAYASEPWKVSWPSVFAPYLFSRCLRVAQRDDRDTGPHSICCSASARSTASPSCGRHSSSQTASSTRGKLATSWCITSRRSACADARVHSVNVNARMTRPGSHSCAGFAL